MRWGDTLAPAAPVGEAAERNPVASVLSGMAVVGKLIPEVPVGMAELHTPAPDKLRGMAVVNVFAEALVEVAVVHNSAPDMQWQSEPNVAEADHKPQVTPVTTNSAGETGYTPPGRRLRILFS